MCGMIYTLILMGLAYIKCEAIANTKLPYFASNHNFRPENNHMIVNPGSNYYYSFFYNKGSHHESDLASADYVHHDHGSRMG